MDRGFAVWDWKDGGSSAELPRQFNAETMYPFLERALEIAGTTTSGLLHLDFHALQFIHPEGVVVLANLIRYIESRGTKIVFRFSAVNTPANIYLDDCGFFLEHSGKRLFGTGELRSTTMPIQRIDGDRSTEYLYWKLIPWIARAIEESPKSIDALRTSLEEIFHNMRDHSGVDAGCVFAQHFPAQKEIRIAVADFGAGIPSTIRSIHPAATDRHALLLACEEGVTAGRNGHNRGAGLPNLIRYVAQRIGGVVSLHSGEATLVAVSGVQRARGIRGFFPGTMVVVSIPTSELRKRAVKDVEPEEFEW